MVSENWKSTNKSQAGFPRPFRDSHWNSGGAPTQKKKQKDGNAFLGFVLFALLHTALLWLTARALESAGIVTWELGVWESLQLATLYVSWQSLLVMLWNGTKRQ